MKEKAELILNGGEKSISSILPIVDDFERALKNMETATDVAAVKEGVESRSEEHTSELQSLR
jgi:molecular chaperone GrpE